MTASDQQLHSHTQAEGLAGVRRYDVLDTRVLSGLRDAPR